MGLKNTIGILEDVKLLNKIFKKNLGSEVFPCSQADISVWLNGSIFHFLKSVTGVIHPNKEPCLHLVSK